MKEDNKKIILIGKLPPPIGGVTIYNKRLLQSLQKKNIEIEVINLSKLNKGRINTFFKSDIVHLSLSNTYIKFTLILISKVLQKNVVTTLHGSFGRFSKFKNYIEILCIRLSYITLLLNDRSYKDLDRFKSKTILSSTDFELGTEELSQFILNKIINLKKSSQKIFCTNSWKLTFDKTGNEIYSVSKLVLLFRQLPNYSLIISDPTGTNKTRVESLNIKVSKNIFFITEDHPFTEILKLSDGFIRATTTDGDALSVREAIKLSIPVFASDSVDRPNECILFNLESIELLKNLLKDYNYLKINKQHREDNKLVDEIIDLYNSLK